MSSTPTSSPSSRVNASRAGPCGLARPLPASARAKARDAAERYIYQYRIAVVWTDAALSFSTTPARGGSWRPANDPGSAAGFYFAKVDNAGLGEAVTSVRPVFLPTLANAQHRQICMRNRNAANCVRFVQVSICRSQTSSDCGAVQSQLMLPVVRTTFPFHKATTIAVAESFGYVPGTAPRP
jgi:hypothetical protein